MKAHSDSEIISQAFAETKKLSDVNENTVDITIDMADDHETTHTYVVSFCRDNAGTWKATDVTELSSL